MTLHLNTGNLSQCAEMHLRLALEFIDRAQVHLGHIYLDHREHLVPYADDVADLYEAISKSATVAQRMAEDLGEEARRGR